jgi:hypothetical protein
MVLSALAAFRQWNCLAHVHVQQWSAQSAQMALAAQQQQDTSLQQASHRVATQAT